MTKLIVNILRLNILRLLRHKLSSKYSDDACYRAFVEEMNAQAREWGMNNTKLINPSGLGEDGVYSQSTAEDLAIMALHVFNDGSGIKFHGKDGYTITVHKPYLIPGYRFKKKTIYSTTQRDTIGDGYPIVGAKTGSGDGYQTLVMVCNIKGKILSGAIMNADDEQGRFDAMDELMRIGEQILFENGEASNFKVKKAKNACLFVSRNSGQIECIYEQNAEEISAPMSTTKVMSLAIVRKYIHNYHLLKDVIPYDLKRIGHDSVYEWDRMTIDELVNVMMRESSNVSANALARITGEAILKHQTV